MEINKKMEELSQKLSPETKERFCKDCKWSRRDFWLNVISLGLNGYDFAKCVNPNYPAINIKSDDYRVDGKAKIKRSFCSVERQDYSELDVCGSKGKYWEQK